MTNILVDKVVETGYVNYARFVNMYRQIPDARDGFKVVQRRILATLLQQGNHGEIIPCSAVIGDCIKFFHPHSSEGLHGAITTLVNDEPSYLDKQGQFGSRGLDPEGPAAYRYTSVGLSGLAIGTVAKLYDFSPTYLNENSYPEPVFIPSTLPYCLIASAMGIGNGIATHIPAFEINDLLHIAKLILSGQPLDTKIVPRPGEGKGHLTIDNDNLESLHNTGKCIVVISPDFTWETEANGQSYLVVDNVPTEVNLNKLLTIFKTEIAEGLIFIRNESAETDRIVIGKNKKIRRISDEEIEAKARKVLCRKVTYKCIVAYNGMPRLLPPYEIMKIALQEAVKANSKWIDQKLEQLNEFILFEKIKNDLAQMLLQKMSISEIQKKLELSSALYKKFVAKALSSLHGSNKDTRNAQSEIKKLTKWKQNPDMAYLERFFSA